ncbi:DUF427 domain-containing protein [bacterium]|nr:DUF427 domain-containing protein [bacterium]
MARAIFNGAVLAESDTFELVEGNVYFPPSSIDKTYLKPSDTTTVCGWKGTASYYNVVVDGEVNTDAAWYYPDPKEAAENIRGFIAFWRGVLIER